MLHRLSSQRGSRIGIGHGNNIGMGWWRSWCCHFFCTHSTVQTLQPWSFPTHGHAYTQFDLPPTMGGWEKTRSTQGTRKQFLLLPSLFFPSLILPIMGYFYPSVEEGGKSGRELSQLGLKSVQLSRLELCVCVCR